MRAEMGLPATRAEMPVAQSNMLMVMGTQGPIEVPVEPTTELTLADVVPFHDPGAEDLMARLKANRAP